MSTQTSSLKTFLVLALLATLTPAFTACASSGKPVDRSVKVTGKLTNDFDTLATNANAVTTAVDALRDSVETQGIINREKVAVGDIEAAFKGFRKAVEGVRTSKKQLASNRSSLKSAMDSYIASWDKEIATYESEDLKKRSQERRDDALARFTRVTEELEQGGLEVDAYIARLGQLDSALVHDLTPGGVSALDDELKKAGSDGEKLGEVATKIADRLREYAGTLQASAPPAPTTP
jgi:exonuclease VII small subunit